MLAYHLNTEIDVSSRRQEFIERSVECIASRFRIDHAWGVATDQGLSVDCINQNSLDFETDAQFDLIVMIMCEFEKAGLTQQEIHADVAGTPLDATTSEFAAVACCSRNMTDLLQRAFERASALPEREQDRFAQFLISEKEALAEYRTGNTRPLDASRDF